MAQLTFDAEYDKYMREVYKKRIDGDKKRAEQEIVMKKRMEEMEKAFLGGKTRAQVEAEMPKGSRGKFGLVGTGKVPKKRKGR